MVWAKNRKRQIFHTIPMSWHGSRHRARCERSNCPFRFVIVGPSSKEAPTCVAESDHSASARRNLVPTSSSYLSRIGSMAGPELERPQRVSRTARGPSAAILSFTTVDSESSKSRAAAMASAILVCGRRCLAHKPSAPIMRSRGASLRGRSRPTRSIVSPSLRLAKRLRRSST